MPTPLETLTAFYASNPTMIDQKFNGDAAKAAESHINLQAAYTQATQKLAQTATPTPAGTPAPTGISIPEPKPQDMWNDLRKELSTTGTISDGLQKRFTDAGIPPDMVQQFTEANRIRQETIINQAKQMLGGESEYNATIAFAQTLSPQERAAINASLQTDAWSVVLSGLNQRRLAANGGREPARTINPNTGVSGGGNPNPSQVQIRGTNAKEVYDSLLLALQDPKAKHDPEYRREVEAQVAKVYGRQK